MLKNYFQLPFQLIHDLVIVPVEINGVELSFLLDTGVDLTILFNLTEVESQNVKNAARILLKGLGAGDPVQGYLLIEINGKKAYQFKLSEINSILSSGEGKRVRFRIMRNGIEKVITFELKRLLL